MEPYTPTTNTWHPTIDSVQDGDPPNETDFRATSDQLADNLGYLHAPLTGSSRRRAVTGAWRYDTAHFKADSTFGGVASLTAVSHSLVIDIDPPHGAILGAVGVIFKGGSGHGGTLPQFPPQVLFCRTPIDGSGGFTVIHSFTDNISGGSYETQHRVECTMTETIDRDTYAYHMMIVNEDGTNAFDDLRIIAPQIRFIPGQYPGGL